MEWTISETESIWIQTDSLTSVTITFIQTVWISFQTVWKSFHIICNLCQTTLQVLQLNTAYLILGRDPNDHLFS